MKKTALAILAFAGTAFAWQPIQTDLQVALFRASLAWGSEADIVAIRMDRISACRSSSDAAALSNFHDRTITINSGCHWTKKMLRVAVEHEYGHMLVSNPEHSEDKRSVMYPQLRNRQHVQPADLALVQQALEARSVRPSILIGSMD